MIFKNIFIKQRKFNNVFEAISNGAIDMLQAVGAIMANLIAFVSIFALLDSVCIWFFSMVNLKSFGLAVKKNNLLFLVG